MRILLPLCVCCIVLNKTWNYDNGDNRQLLRMYIIAIKYSHYDKYKNQNQIQIQIQILTWSSFADSDTERFVSNEFVRSAVENLERTYDKDVSLVSTVQYDKILLIVINCQ